MYDGDKMYIKYEITDDYLDGGITRTSVEKDVELFALEETHLSKAIDVFAEFLSVYGFTEETIIQGLKEFVEYKEEMKE